MRLATLADKDLINRWRQAFFIDIYGEIPEGMPAGDIAPPIESGNVYLWEDDAQPVSLAIKGRPTERGMTVSMVYTPLDQRGRGYATAYVGELSRLLLESGWAYCALFADVTNEAAIRVYKGLGYRPVSLYDEILFQGTDSSMIRTRLGRSVAAVGA